MIGTSLKLSDLLILYQQTRQESDFHSFFKHNQSYLQRVNKFHLVWKFNVLMELHYIHICTIWVLIKINECWVWVSEEWRLRLAGKFMWWSRLHPDTGRIIITRAVLTSGRGTLIRLWGQYSEHSQMCLCCIYESYIFHYITRLGLHQTDKCKKHETASLTQ